MPCTRCLDRITGAAQKALRVSTPATLELTTAARFFVDRKPVSFAELRTLALKSSANVVVFYDTKTNAVTRIVVTDVR